MSRAGEGGRLKKNNCCLTCSIISFVLLIVFIAALFIGGNILFKQYVSPKIGGVGLTDALSLAGKFMSGKETKASYTEDDLDGFYTELSSSLFLSEKSEEELEYELLDDEAKASLDVTTSAGEEESNYPESTEENAKPTYDDDAAYAAFLLLSTSARYELLTDEVKALCSVVEYGKLSEEGSKETRKRLGLKMYRISIDSLLGDGDFSATNFSSEEMTNRAFASLDFNFETLADYDIDDPNAPQNTEFTTFSVGGKQVSAFINDVLNYFLSSASSSSMTDQYQNMLPEGKTLGDYITIAGVTIKNSPILVSGQEAVYDQKDTELSVTISIKLRDLIKEMMSTDEVQKNLQSMPGFLTGSVPSFVPKYLSVSAFIYPLAKDADEREVRVKVNKMTDKNARDLSKIVNALANQSSSGESVEKTFFRKLNDQIVDVFSKINDKVKINFVPSLDKEGKPLKDSSGKTYSELQIMTIETLLSLMDNSGSLSAHEIFTVLKCLYVTENEPAALSLSSSLSSFKTEASTKYGVDLEYLNENNLLSSDALQDLLTHINLSNGTVDFTKSNEQMQVQLSAEALAALMVEMISEKANGGVAAAEEESGSKNIFEGLHPEVCSITLEKVEEKAGRKLYSFELMISIEFADLLSSYTEGNASTSKLANKILPKGKSYFGIKMMLSEETVDGKLVHKAGKAIAKSGESASSFATAIRINDFTYDQTANVIATINKFMDMVGGSSDFDLSSITDSIEEIVSNLFESMQSGEFKLSIRLYEKNQTSKGGILLPSIYEIVESLVAPRLEGSETFTAADAQQILAVVYAQDVDKSVSFTDSQADDLLSDVNDKFYISYDSRLVANDLFGDGAANLSDKINANVLYFKPSAEEQNKWQSGYTKPALFTDARSIDNLRVALTGGEIAALIKTCGILPEDLSSSFGGFNVLGASFETVDGATYLTFDVLCEFSKTAAGESGSEEGEEKTDLSVLFPSNIKLSFRVLMSAPSYTEANPRFSSTIRINDNEANKIFSLLKAFGGESLTPSALSDKIQTSISSVFTALEAKIPVYYSNAGTGYSVTIGGKAQACVYLADVFTALVDIMSVKDTINESTGDEIPEEQRPIASAADFRAKMQEFGRMPSYNLQGDSATWSVDVSGVTNFFTDDDLDAFLAAMKSNYYLKNDLTAQNIMGEHTSFDVNADSVSFPALYADERPVSQLNVPLTGSALGALVKSALGEIEMGENAIATLIQSAIRFENNQTPLVASDDKIFLDLTLLVNLTDSSTLLPTHIFVKAVIDLGYDFVNDRFPAELTCTANVTINNLSENQTKNMFGYISTLGGSLSLNTITTQVAKSIQDGIKDMLKLYPDGTVTVSEDAIVLPDVFTFLINYTTMSNATPETLASRLRGFGYQLNAHADPENLGDDSHREYYNWVNDLKLFASTDDMYVYTNMQRAYFMKDKPNMDDIYDGVGSLFSTIDDSTFNLKGADGLYRYDGDIKTLKISDKALGVMIKSKQSFSSAVASGVGASLESVRIYIEGGDMRIESGIKITLGNNAAYSMLPKYFFVKALTVESGSSANGYATTITVNNLSRLETVAFFQNYTALNTVGVSNAAFNLTNLETEINKAIGNALNSFTSSVTIQYGQFTSSDITNEYNTTNYPDDQISVHADDGYISVPSVYSFMIDLLYPATPDLMNPSSIKPAEAEMQHMLNNLYKEESELTDSLVTNATDDTSFNKTNVYDSSDNKVAIYSDRYLASVFATILSGQNVNGDIEIQGIRQAIVIRANDTDVQDEWWAKFFADDTEFNRAHDYMIVTAVADLSHYTSGSATSLVPGTLWFTVWIDLTLPAQSRGLLYDMNAKDMDIFQFILNRNGSNTAFNINAIAVQLANMIVGPTGAINTLKMIAGGTSVSYYADADSFLYANGTPFASNVQANVADDPTMNGKGYIVIA